MKTRENPTQPTPETYTEFQKAYDFFNQELFEGSLPNCLITLQRKPRTKGYFSEKRFEHYVRGRTTDELAMNPAYFKNNSLEDILSTIVHEEVHVWQAWNGKPGRRGYHNKEWAEKMKEIGLYPSDTGAPGGKETGDRVSHYIISRGLFQKAFHKLTKKGFKISWHDRYSEKEGKGKIKTNTRSKYSCPECHLNAWAKPEAWLVCGECESKMEELG